jgi:hypothetical protein
MACEIEHDIFGNGDTADGTFNDWRRPAPHRLSTRHSERQVEKASNPAIVSKPRTGGRSARVRVQRIVGFRVVGDEPERTVADSSRSAARSLRFRCAYWMSLGTLIVIR